MHVCCVSFNKVISIAVLLSLSVCHFCMCFAKRLKIIKQTLRYERHVTLHRLLVVFGLHCTQLLLLYYITRQRIGKRFRWCMRRSWHVIDVIWGAEPEKRGCRFRAKPVVMLCLGWWRAASVSSRSYQAVQFVLFLLSRPAACTADHLTSPVHATYLVPGRPSCDDGKLALNSDRAAERPVYSEMSLPRHTRTREVDWLESIVFTFRPVCDCCVELM